MRILNSPYQTPRLLAIVVLVQRDIVSQSQLYGRAVADDLLHEGVAVDYSASVVLGLRHDLRVVSPIYFRNGDEARSEWAE